MFTQLQDGRKPWWVSEWAILRTADILVLTNFKGKMEDSHVQDFFYLHQKSGYQLILREGTLLRLRLKEGQKPYIIEFSPIELPSGLIRSNGSVTKNMRSSVFRIHGRDQSRRCTDEEFATPLDIDQTQTGFHCKECRSTWRCEDDFELSNTGELLLPSVS